MEEMVNALNRIADSMASNLPVWASITGLIVPIVLTVVSIILSYRMDKQNKNLQKLLSYRDSINQTRQIILNIYNSFVSALDLVAQANGNVPEIFVSEQSYYQWALEVESTSSDIMLAFNQAQLIIQDEELLNLIREAKNRFSQLASSVKSYIYTDIPTKTIKKAWDIFVHKYNVEFGNYVFLLANPTLASEFIGYCDTDYTKKIQTEIEQYIEIVGKDTFDEPFKKHVQIKEF